MAAGAAAALAKVGVELAVAELGKFVSDMRKADDSIKKLGPSGTLVGRALSGLAGVVSGILDSAFKTVTGTISGVFMSALRTVEYAIGTLLAGAIQGVIGFLKDMGAEVAEAAQEFQRMELRLNRFNLKEIKGNFEDMTEAQAEAVKMTKEQLKWLNKLAASTPFDAQDVANTYALARSYGFASDEAQSLVGHITNFASGMGLTEEHIKRVVINFGQMKAAGKITGTELRDLARGAFVPVNDILERTADLLGISNEKLALLRKKGLTDAEMFFVAFGEMAEEDFAGAATDMNAVLDVSINNLKDMLRAFLSLEVVKGIFESLGHKVSGFQDALYQRWDELESIAERIGGVLTRVVEVIVNRYLPKVKDLSDGVVSGLDGIATWLEDNEVAILKWVKSSTESIQEWVYGTLIPAVQEIWKWLFGEGNEQGAIQKFGAWISNTMIPFVRDEAIPAIKELWKWLFGSGQTAETVNPFEGALHQPMEESPSQDQGAVREFINWITNEFIPRIQEAGQAIATHLIPFLQDDLLPIFQELVPLGEAIADVFLAAMGVEPNTDLSEWIHTELIPAIRDLTTWVEENKDMLALLFKAFVALQIIIFIASLVSMFIGWIVTGIAMLALFGAKIALVTILFSPIGLAILAVIAIFKWFEFVLEFSKNQLQAWVDFYKNRFRDWKENVTRIIKEVSDALTNGDWWGAGRAIVDGLWRGIKSGWNNVVQLAKDLANAAKKAFESTFQIQSPSAVMFDIGENIVKGLAAGIAKTGDLAVKSMQSMAGAVMAPAMQTAQMSMSAMPNNVNNTTYNRTAILNLTTNAKSEPIIQDFAMLESMT